MLVREYVSPIDLIQVEHHPSDVYAGYYFQLPTPKTSALLRFRAKYNTGINRQSMYRV